MRVIDDRLMTGSEQVDRCFITRAKPAADVLPINIRRRWRHKLVNNLFNSGQYSKNDDLCCHNVAYDVVGAQVINLFERLSTFN